MSERKDPTGKIVLGVVTLILVAVLAFGSIYKVKEGYEGVVLKFSKADYFVEPGLHYKVPFINSVQKMEIRERRSSEEMFASSKNQLPITAVISINWSVDKGSSMELFVKYGGIPQFEDRILAPKLRQASKAALAKFNVDELIRNRTAAIGAIQEEMLGLMENYPVTLHSPQIENLVLPETYLNAVLEKEQARESAAKEQYKLEKQKLEAAQLTQTAEAERDAVKARADGEAYRVRTEADAQAESTRLRGEAEADAIKAVENALKANPLLVEYEKSKRWDGKLPTTMIPNGTTPLLSIK